MCSLSLSLLVFYVTCDIISVIYVTAQMCRRNEEVEGQTRSSEGCSKLKRSVDMTSSGKNDLNIRTNASPKWDQVEPTVGLPTP